MLRIAFDPEAIEAIKYERLHHPHPRVQQKMWAVWLKVCELPHHEICRIADVSENTLRGYLREFLAGGVEALKVVSFHKPQSELDDYAETLEAHFRQQPPRTAAEAQAVIEQRTGIKRSPTQVREFLHRMGMKCRKVGAIPAKANPEVQEAFKKKSWSHVWSKPRRAQEGSTSWTLPTSFNPPSLGSSGASRASSFEAVPAGNGSTSWERCAPRRTS
jgi:transposase